MERERKSERETFSRRRWRCAVRIARALTIAFHERQQVLLPERWFQQARDLAARHELVRSRGWAAAADQLRWQLLLRVQWLQTELKLLQQTLQMLQTPMPAPSAADVYRELVALEQEFERVDIAPQSTRLTVITERIILRGIDFGPFELVWNWSAISGEDELRARALEPCRPNDREDVTHPHVQDHQLCEGEASLPLEQALRSGRLCDYFAILQQTLKTYNPSSPYVHLEDWFSRRCSSCNDTMDECDESDCHACGEILCCDCIACCAECHASTCRSCLDACPECHRDICASCQPEGGFCRGVCCDSCQTAKDQNETDTADDEEKDSGTDAAGAAVQSVCLGEVGVPA